MREDDRPAAVEPLSDEADPAPAPADTLAPAPTPHHADPEATLAGSTRARAGRRAGHVLLGLWLLGTAACLVRVTRSHWLLHRLLRTTRPVDGAWQPRVHALARRLGLRRRVRLCESPAARTPLACGWRRLRIVVPAGYLDQWDRPHGEAVLAHELSHLAAADPLWRLLADLLAALCWWHPAAWHLRGRLAAASETAADEACQILPDGPTLLADCLVSLGRRLASHPSSVAALAADGAGFRSGLGRRVEHLMALPQRTFRPLTRSRRAAGWLVAPLTLVMATVSCTAWARPRASLPTERSDTMKVFQSAWGRSLTAAAAAAMLTAVGLQQASVRADDDDKPAAKRDGDPPKDAPKRDGDRPRDDEPKRDGDRPREGAPKDPLVADREIGKADKDDDDRPREDGRRNEEERRGLERRGERDRERDGDQRRSEEEERDLERRGDRDRGPRDDERLRDRDLPRLDLATPEQRELMQAGREISARLRRIRGDSP